MISEIDTPIEVLASFGRRGIRPQLFIWEKRRYPVSEITATWTQNRGLFRSLYFAVITDGANLYELCFETKDLAWRLRRIHHD